MIQKLSKEKTEQSDNTFQQLSVREHVEFVVIGGQIYQKKCWFPKHKDYSTIKDRREEIGNEGNINIKLKAHQ